MITPQEKLKQIWEMVNNDAVKPSDLKEFVLLLAKVIKDEKSNFVQKSSDNIKVIETFSTDLQSKYSGSVEKMSASASQALKDIQSTISEFKASLSIDINKTITEMNSLVDVINALELQDGQDGEDGSPDTAEQVRDKLESLPEDSKLSINAIEELPTLLESIQKMINDIPKTKGVSGNYGVKLVRFIDDFTPIGTINGINTVFTLLKTPVSGSLKVYRGGARQRITEDYTFDGHRTITFIIAPEVGEILLVDFRY